MRSVFLSRNKLLRRFLTAEFLLLPFWLFGLFSGKHAALMVGSDISKIIFSTVTLNGTFLIYVFFPLVWIVLTYIALRQNNMLVLLLAFIKSWMLGFTGAGCSVAFGSAGWLIRLLLLHSELIHSVILLLLCYDGFQSNGIISRKRLFGYLSATALTELLDYLVISRFLTSLF